MYILFTNKKLVILWLFAVFLMINLKGSVEAQDMQTIVKEKYSFTIKSYSEVIKRPIFEREIPCGSPEEEYPLPIEDNFRMTIDDKYLKEILTAFGLEYNIGINQERLKATIEVRNQLARESIIYKAKGIFSEITEKVVIKERQCCNQKAFLVLTRKKYKIKTTKDKIGRDKVFNFDWEDDKEHHVVIEAEYDETCNDQCHIQGKKDRVKGKKDEDQWARIPYKDQEIYIVPLYWGKDWKLLQVIPLLPEDVIN